MSVTAPNSLYTGRVASRMIRDPCASSPDYEEGLRRAEMYLDEASIKKIMKMNWWVKEIM